MYFQFGTRLRVWQVEFATRAIVQEAEEREEQHHEVLSSDMGFQRQEYYEED